MVLGLPCRPIRDASEDCSLLVRKVRSPIPTVVDYVEGFPVPKRFGHKVIGTACHGTLQTIPRYQLWLCGTARTAHGTATAVQGCPFYSLGLWHYKTERHKERTKAS